MFERFYQCPFCWQRVSVLIEPTEGTTEWIEDCEVCCRPILFQVTIEAGEIIDFSYERSG